MLFKSTGLTMTIPSPVSRLTLFNKFTGLGVGHILSIAISIGSGLAIGFVQFSPVAFTASCGMVLGIVLVFFLSCIRIGRVVFSRSRFTQGLTSKLVSHESQFEQR